jgi:hypothetical protein
VLSLALTPALARRIGPGIGPRNWALESGRYRERRIADFVALTATSTVKSARSRHWPDPPTRRPADWVATTHAGAPGHPAGNSGQRQADVLADLDQRRPRPSKAPGSTDSVTANYDHIF